ncbi:hypothetical protein VNO77_09402 [Canavalia gladiata]|uniref:Uncharacterized protein n=1 Tax=Canavalia gladiata TaxID=3824 RepID=A0AAN9QX05_CANGL
MIWLDKRKEQIHKREIYDIVYILRFQVWHECFWLYLKVQESKGRRKGSTHEVNGNMTCRLWKKEDPLQINAMNEEGLDIEKTNSNCNNISNTFNLDPIGIVNVVAQLVVGLAAICSRLDLQGPAEATIAKRNIGHPTFSGQHQLVQLDQETIEKKKTLKQLLHNHKLKMTGSSLPPRNIPSARLSQSFTIFILGTLPLQMVE